MISQTSLEAYESIKPKISSDHTEILSVLDAKQGLTYREISNRVYKKLLLSSNPEVKQYAFAWKNPNKASRRMSELVRDNKVKVLETRICSIAKSRCKTYVKL